jgi:Restriction endonuclease
MTGPQFEQYVAAMLRFSGFRNVRVIGGAGDGGVDILATNPAGVAIACQCKRQNQRVSTKVVRLLLLAVTYTHKGNLPYLITTATLTKQAGEEARAAKVRVIDRRGLDTWMADARSRLATATTNQPAGTSGSGETARPSVAMSPPAIPLRPDLLSPATTAGDHWPRPDVPMPSVQNRLERPELSLAPPTGRNSSSPPRSTALLKLRWNRTVIGWLIHR